MLSSARWLLPPAIVLAMLNPARPAALTPGVKDNAGFFGAAAVQKANDQINDIRQQHRMDLVIETFKTVPSSRIDEVKRMDRGARQRFFAAWLNDRMKRNDVKDIYVLICRNPGHVQVGAGEHARRAFPRADQQKLTDLLLAKFKEKDHDQGLLDGVRYVRTTLDKNAPAAGSGRVGGWVKDAAGFFKAETVKKAEARIKQINDRFKQSVLIETFKTVPADRAKEVADMDARGRERFFTGWLRDVARQSGLDGIYVLVCKEPAHVQVGVGAQTEKKAFTPADRDRLSKLLLEGFRAKEFDRGLLDGLDLVDATLARNLGTPAAQPEQKAPAPAAGDTTPPKTAGERGKEEAQGFQWVWLLWIALGLLGLWIVIGVLRALFRPRPQQGYGQPPGYGAGGPAQAGPPPGYGGGQGPPPLPPSARGYGGGYGPGGGYFGGGGGGGGFFSGLLGGMFGAAAGNWVYDSFFRSSAPPTGGGWGSTAHGAPPAPPQDQPTPSGDEISSTGGDFDDSSTEPGAVSSTGGDFGDDSAGEVQSTGGDFDDQSQNVADSTGGDFGNADSGSTGGDFGDTGSSDAGGGDVGGGGDFGGGGDSGGSGGDF